jgi:hypothetical protein
VAEFVLSAAGLQVETMVNVRWLSLKWKDDVFR